MVRLSVNLNRVALLRNSRGVGIPDVVRAAHDVIDAGADGITVHPRPDQRHITPADVFSLAEVVKKSGVEYNIEGNPFPEYMRLVREVRPAQATLVPDDPDQATSDHGFVLRDGESLTDEAQRLRPLVAELRELGIRTSVFMDPDPAQIEAVPEVGVDRIELYTEAYARAFGTPREDEVLEQYRRAAALAVELGLGVNAGHDLNQQNLPRFSREIPGLEEVSIGHALIGDALFGGLSGTVRAYLDALGR